MKTSIFCWSPYSQYSDTPKQLLRTNQKFLYKFFVFKCMTIAQNYAQLQVSLPLTHTFWYSKMADRH